MERVFVVFGVARPEMVVIVPAQEGKESKERPIEPFRSKHGVVDQFVEAVDEKLPVVSVCKDDQRGHIPWPMVDAVEGGTHPGAQDAEVAERLSESQQITATVELGEFFPGQRTPIPYDPCFRGGNVINGTFGQDVSVLEVGHWWVGLHRSRSGHRRAHSGEG